MRLDSLYLKNFRGYEEIEFNLHPSFNLIIGENASGKTSILEAMAVSIGSWISNIGGHDSRHIISKDVRIVLELIEKRYRELPQYPVVIRTRGSFDFLTALRQNNDEIQILEKQPSETIVWERTLQSRQGRTTQIGAADIKKIAVKFRSSILKGNALILPIIRYFGSGRLWEAVRDAGTDDVPMVKIQTKNDADAKEIASPFYGYRFSLDRRYKSTDMLRWMKHERRVELDENEDSLALRLVYRAIETMLPEAKSVRYSVNLGTLVLHNEKGGRFSFENLSDGYRNIIAIVADLAIKAAMLNPQLAEKALERTPGVVLIDELDLHLHPRWQRRVIEDLRRTFPKVQFICTTHSPFLIQSLRSGEELIILDGQSTDSFGNLGIEAITSGIMGVLNPEVSPRYHLMLNEAKAYLAELEEAEKTPRERLEEYKRQLAERIAPYAENPAFQALLEAERIFKIGK